MDKLVTIIIPTIGRGELLRASIISATLQTYANIEILVSDNFSNSKVEKIVEDINDKRINLITRNSRLDFSSHIRLCIEDVKGEYIMLLSDDDLISSDYITELVKMFDDDEDVGLGISSQVILGPNDLVLNDDGGRVNGSVMDGWEFLQKFILGQIPVPLYSFISVFARRQAWQSKEFYREFWPGSNASHVDNYFLFANAINSKVAISSGLFGYRVYPESVGLTTPFILLGLATKNYGRLVSRLINLKLSRFTKKYILYSTLLKYSLVEMLYVRLDKYYKKEVSLVNYIKYFLSVFYFYPIISIYYIFFRESISANRFISKLKNYLLQDSGRP